MVYFIHIHLKYIVRRKLMKHFIKLFIISIVIISMISLLSCKEDAEPEIVGSYLEITVRGQYYDENTGETTSDEEELKAIINLYPVEDDSGRVNTGGHFSSPNTGGIMYSSNIGFSNTEFSDGTAHVNGFISKGPMSEGSTVELALIDENMNRIEIDPEFVSDIQSETDQLSEFSIELPATDDADIEINVNALTTLQVERMYDLIDEGLSFYDAHLQSKEEVLALVDLDSDSSMIEDFETLDIREDGESNGALLLASAMLSESADSTRDKQSASLLQQVIEEMANNEGAILNEQLSDKMRNIWVNADPQQMMSMLQTYLENNGHTNVNIPNPEQFMDHDGDGIINMFDFALIEPVGQIQSFPTNGFNWQEFTVPNHPDINVSYMIQISTDPYFNPMKSFPPIVIENGSSFMVDNPMATIKPATTYYWRVAPITNGHIRRWVASSSFRFGPEEMPTGTLSALSGETTPTRQFIIDTSQIEGANQMRFSLGDDVFDPLNFPHESWRPFQLYQGWLLPEENSTYTIYAEFKNSSDDVYSTSFDVTLDTANPPGGGWGMNGGMNKTLYRKIIINTSNITNAFKMRFTSNGTYDTFEERWRLYQKYFVFEIPEEDFVAGNTITIDAEFANSAGTVSKPIQLDLVNSYTLTVNMSEGLGVNVGIDWDDDQNGVPDVNHTFFAMRAPYEIEVEQGDVVTLSIEESIMGNISFDSWLNVDPNNASITYDVPTSSGVGTWTITMDGDKSIFASSNVPKE